jgi:ketosteroid isomerase-like protein
MLVLALPALSCVSREAWSPADTRAVETTLADYRRAWLNNDSIEVMDLISDDVTLFVPGATAATIVGKANLRSFWFPTTDTVYVIRTYEVTNQEVHGSGGYAIVEGRSLLSWDTVSRDSVLGSATSRSEYLAILRKEDGNWRIFRQMYVLRE